MMMGDIYIYYSKYIDVTTYSRGGYHGDLNETFSVGEC
jgi:hypothetical protein